MNPSKLIRYIILGSLAALIATYLLPNHRPPRNQHGPRDYADIAREGILAVTTEYNSLDFHVEGDTVDGMNYRLINQFAADHGLKAEITPLMSFEERLEGLLKGRFDIIACDIPTTSELKDSLLFSTPILLNRQVLVQRMPQDPADTTYIKSQIDLAHKTIHLVKGSPTLQRINHLSNEIGDTIYVLEIEKYGPEQLIAMVAHGDINYTVCEENLARAVADSLPGIDISTAISFNQFYAWAMSKHAPALRDSVNLWLKKHLK